MCRIVKVAGLLLALTLIASSLLLTACGGGGGNKIAFISSRDGHSEVYVMNSDGSAQTKLTDTNQRNTTPAWSPDRKQIAFATGGDGHEDIYVSGASGGTPTPLTYFSAYNSIVGGNRHPSWSPDGTKIVFESKLRGPGWQIYVMDANGTNKISLSDNTANDEVHPDWSPDGKSIVFAVNTPPLDDDNYDIYVMNIESKKRTRLTENSATDWYPAWSPDGKHIAFITNRDNSWQVYVMDASGENWTRLADSQDGGVAWSPDGKRIAYEYKSEIYVMNADGSEQTRLTDSTGENTYPAW